METQPSFSQSFSEPQTTDEHLEDNINDLISHLRHELGMIRSTREYDMSIDDAFARGIDLLHRIPPENTELFNRFDTFIVLFSEYSSVTFPQRQIRAQNTEILLQTNIQQR